MLKTRSRLVVKSVSLVGFAAATLAAQPAGHSQKIPPALVAPSIDAQAGPTNPVFQTPVHMNTTQANPPQILTTTATASPLPTGSAATTIRGFADMHTHP